MANPWQLYQTQPSFILGFHGTEKALVGRCMAEGTEHLASSQGRYEWLGHGIYFWENDPQRGLEWASDGNAKKRIQEPDVIGAVLDLGYCLDLTTRIGLDEVSAAYVLLKESYALLQKDMPSNTGGRDRFKRELDCQVIQAVHLFRKEKGLPQYDSVRALFPEDALLYEGSGFQFRNHIQIAIINPDCIKGYFRPIKK